MKRFKQFFSALRAKVTAEDETFAGLYLSECELRLFNRMSIPDRKHCLNVAYTARLLAKDLKNVDVEKLIKAALLHDVGRRQGDLSIFDKAAAVIINKAAGSRLVAAWGKQGRGSIVQNLRHALYVSRQHPAIGAELLSSCGTDASVVFLVRNHHNYRDRQTMELELLQKADELN